MKNKEKTKPREFVLDLEPMLKKYKVFYAFDDEQLADGLNKYSLDIDKDDVISYGLGAHGPKANLSGFNNGMYDAYKKLEKEKFDYYGKEMYISRELSNHECWWTGDWQEAKFGLDMDLVTDEEVQDCYRRNVSKEITPF